MNYQELPVQMHPRYQDFLEFMRDCPERQSPQILVTAFWVWLNVKSESLVENMDIAVFGAECSEKIQSLKNDLDRLHRERDSFQQQCSSMAEENARLNALIDTLRQALNEVGD